MPRYFEVPPICFFMFRIFSDFIAISVYVNTIFIKIKQIVYFWANITWHGSRIRFNFAQILLPPIFSVLFSYPLLEIFENRKAFRISNNARQLAVTENE